MNTLYCHLCGGHDFFAVEFRNTKTNKILVGCEEVDLICPHCGYVVFQVREGRAEQCHFSPAKMGRRIRIWLKHFKSMNPIKRVDIFKKSKPG